MENQSKTGLEELTMVVQLHVKMPGIHRKADKTQTDLGGADEDMMNVSKRIVDSSEYRAIARHVHLMKNYLKTIGLPSPILKGGTYSIPIARLESVLADIEERKTEFFGLVEQFIAVLPEKIDDAEERLGPQFREDDYLGEERMRAAFDIIVSVIETKVPGRLRELSPTLYESERQKHELRFVNLEKNIEGLLLGEFKELMDKMVSMTGYREDGKKMGFHKATAKKLSEFLREAPHRNVVNSKELDKMVDQTAKLLEGVDPEIVRDDESYRNTLHESFELVQGRLEGLLSETSRDITFDEEV